MAKVILARNLCSQLLQGNTFLGRSDITVYAVTNNDELLRVHRKEQVDLIVSEISLPGTNGDQIFPLIREDKNLRSVPVIMVCAQDPGDVQKCAQCGVSDIIFRPINVHLILARAQHFLALFTRESSRFPQNTAIDAVCGSSHLSCRSVDISASGMRIETDRVLALGDCIVCSFSLPGSPKIVADAEIVSILQSPYGAEGRRYGVRFKNLAFDAQCALQAFVGLRSRAAA